MIKNVIADGTLRLPDGKASKAPITPGVYAVIKDGFALFNAGQKAGKSGLETLAEDGNAEALIRALKNKEGVREAGMFLPGQSFEVAAEPGGRLVFASMFVQSNDKFYAPDPNGIALFDSMSAPISGDWTKSIRLWDAGTEKDETPGLGLNQAPRHPATNTGPAEWIRACRIGRIPVSARWRGDPIDSLCQVSEVSRSCNRLILRAISCAWPL